MRYGNPAVPFLPGLIQSESRLMHLLNAAISHWAFRRSATCVSAELGAWTIQWTRIRIWEPCTNIVGSPKEPCLFSHTQVEHTGASKLNPHLVHSTSVQLFHNSAHNSMNYSSSSIYIYSVSLCLYLFQEVVMHSELKTLKAFWTHNAD